MLDRFFKTSSVGILKGSVVIDPTMGDGRPIPSLIIDTRFRPDIKDYIIAQENQPPSDVTVQWGVGFMDNNEVSLLLKSQRPTKIEFGIRFQIDKHDSLIDGILKSNGIYLQFFEIHDKVSHFVRTGKIKIEVGDTGFESQWEKLLFKYSKKRFKNKGLNKKQAAKAAKDYIDSMREFWSVRKKA